MLTLPVVAPRALTAATASVPPPVVVGSAVQVSAVLERGSTGPMFTERPAQVIRAARGDTLESLAATFHSDASAMRWANGLVDLTEPEPGQQLLVPPGPGSIVHLERAERPSHFAARLGLDPRVILDYNSLRSDDPVARGRWLQVPRSQAPEGAVPSDWLAPTEQGLPAVPSTQHAHGVNRYPYGQCTYYVATRRNVTWPGDAWMWWANGRASGRPEGHLPVVGAIVVTWDSWVGHVAYVEKVNSDGTFVVSEMNVRGWGLVDERTISPDKAGVVGFIY